MKTSSFITSLFCLITLASALSIPDLPGFNSLEKRKGGGHGGGGSGGGGRGSSSSGGGGGRSTSSYSFSPKSNLGGRTRDGSGTPTSYENRYAGGAVVPYTSGQTHGSVAPVLLPASVLLFFPALWLFPVFAYPYTAYPGYTWLDAQGRNRTANVTCLCQQYSVCGCESPDAANATALRALARQLTNGTGTGAPVNSTLVRVVDFSKDNTTAYINGTLDNGTTAAGGTDPSNEGQINAATRLVLHYAGYWLMATVVGLLANTV